MIAAMALLLVNIGSFALFGIDKHRARHRGRRVRESHLLAVAIMGGSPGALLGRHVFRHKTRKQPFSTWLHIVAAAQAIGLIAWMSG